jgi:hypothetical protein
VFAGLHGVANGEAEPDRAATEAAVFRLWAAGVLAVVYPTNGLDDSAWAILRRSLAAARLGDGIQRACVAAVLTRVWGEYRTDLDAREHGAPGEAALLAFFAAAFGPAADTGDVVGAILGDVAARLGVGAAALAARFVDHGSQTRTATSPPRAWSERHRSARRPPRPPSRRPCAPRTRASPRTFTGPSDSCVEWRGWRCRGRIRDRRSDPACWMRTARPWSSRSATRSRRSTPRAG